VRHRLAALDWMRGIVMILMVSDHASGAFNAGHLSADSVLLYDPSAGLDPVQFLYRWASHLCAPTFLFLAGASLALSIGRKTDAGVSNAVIDRDLLIRGLVIISVDLLFINIVWARGTLLLQVMYAIGGAMLLMIFARRVPAPLLAVLAAAALLMSEARLTDGLRVSFTAPALANAFMFSPGLIDTRPESAGLLSLLNPFNADVVVAYPLLPWWALMVLGWTFGRGLHAGRPEEGRVARLCGAFGAAGLLLFFALRGFNGFGNLRLFRLDNSLVQWLHVSKYPPSLTFVGLELGMMGLILAGLFMLQKRSDPAARGHDPVLVFGQTAFFFYVAHIFLLEAAARALRMHHDRGLGEAVLAGGVVCAALYPVCLAYRNFKQRHPRSLLRYF
jgi:uncharacterized membrane protein